MKQNDNSSELSGAENFTINKIWIVLLGEQSFDESHLNIQANFLRKLETQALEIACQLPKASSQFLARRTKEFKKYFPLLDQEGLKRIRRYLDGMIIYLHFYQLESFSELEQHIEIQKKRTSRHLFQSDVLSPAPIAISSYKPSKSVS